MELEKERSGVKIQSTARNIMSRMSIDVCLICREENCPDIFAGEDHQSFLKHVAILGEMLETLQKLEDGTPLEDTHENRQMIQQLQCIAKVKKPPVFYSFEEMDLYARVKAASRKKFCSRKKNNK